jgi:hypothetical protein
MTTRFGRSFGAMALVLSMAAMGCDGGGDEGPTFPDDTMEINGTEAPIVAANVWYHDGTRYVEFQDADGYKIEFTFENQGDPYVTAYELPLGRWSGFDSDLAEVTITGPSISATYNGGSPYEGWLNAGGSPPDNLTLDTAFTFSAGPVEGFQISYSGPYHYAAD